MTASHAPSAASLCHAKRAVEPGITVPQTRSASSSQLEPGKRTMAMCIARLRPLSDDLDAVVLDHRVGEQLLAHGLETRPGVGPRAVELDLDVLADAHVGGLGEAQPPEGALHRLPLRVEHPA